MGHIIAIILFTAVVIYISNRRASATPAGTPAEPTGIRRVREKAAAAPAIRSHRPVTVERHRPLVETVSTPPSRSSAPLLDPSQEGESVTGYTSSMSDNKSRRKAKEEATSTATAAHYARWRQAVIDTTVLTPLQ